MNSIERGRHLDLSIADVSAVYSGPGGDLWEMLMGEEIHIGGETETDALADAAEVCGGMRVLDVCSAVGGPARHLARRYGCRVTGLDATEKMVSTAIARTASEGLAHLAEFRLGNALDMPFRAGTFDIVWGQDAWCYVTDKRRLIGEAYRVLCPGGTIAFTDWIQTGTMADSEWRALVTFMVFPSMETLEGYALLLEDAGFVNARTMDVSAGFAAHCRLYLEKLRNELKDPICARYGEEMFRSVEEGLIRWESAAERGKVGRGRWIARRPES